MSLLARFAENLSAPSALSNQRFLVPESVQTSAMDCGPAALKSLLEGFGISASYGRLREACQTDVDGTSINTLEDVAQQLGLQAEQMMAPADHLLLPSAQLLPALVVTILPNGFNHFVIAWRVHGPVVQLMDPATGRRWVTHRRFLDEVYRYTVPYSAVNWRGWAATDGFLSPLRERLQQLTLPSTTTDRLLSQAIADESWRGLATLDAATRMVTSIVQAKGIGRGKEATQLLAEFFAQAHATGSDAQTIIPASFWSVRPLSNSLQSATPSEQLLLMQGAVLLKIAATPPIPQPVTPVSTAMETEKSADALAFAGDSHEPYAVGEQNLTQETTHKPDSKTHILRAVLTESTTLPEWELLRAMRQDGLLSPLLIGLATLLAALSVAMEAALLRGLMVLAADFQLGVWQWVLAAGLVAFVVLLLMVEVPVASIVLRMGRRLETRMRMAFLKKIPRLGDRYFHSRLISDMAQRAYGLHQIYSLPDLTLRFLRLAAQLIFTTAGIIWLYPAAFPIALLAMVSVIAGAVLLQPIQNERDMRVRTHTGALSRFYLDALMGLLPIRTHSAERTVRREHEMLLVVWARESLSLARIETFTQSVANLLGVGFVIWIVISYIATRGEAAAVLLLIYWSLNIPALGQSLALSARQYPAIRNNLARILEPLGAPEEEMAAEPNLDETAVSEEHEVNPLETIEENYAGVELTFEKITVQAGGHIILSEVELTVQPGEHVAIVGESGAGKSSLVGLLLGWHRPAAGRLLVDGLSVTGAVLQQLRRQTAWVDPSIQLWNRTLQANLYYGNQHEDLQSGGYPIGSALAGADLYDVLERLPNGLQTRLGEGGGLVSGGEGQRVRLGRALLRTGVRLAILDEPFRGLDRAKRRQLLAEARRHWATATLLCITHDIAETVNFSRVLVIEGGRIVEDGPPQTLLATPSSRYRSLFSADETIQQQRWNAATWRRLWLADGGLQTHPLSTNSASPNTRLVTPTVHTVDQRLTQIRGIGPVWAERFQAIGIETIADLATADVAEIERQLLGSGRRPAVKLSDWIAQAQQLTAEYAP